MGNERTRPARSVEAKRRVIGRALDEFTDSTRVPTEESVAPTTEPTWGERPVDQELQQIARRIRRWREEAELTLQELARRSSVAASTIHKVETQQMVPTIAVLLKISRGLDRAPSELVREASDELRIVHLHPEERHAVGLRERMVVERLVGDLFDTSLEVWRVSHQPGSGSGTELIRFDGEEVIIAEAGEITFRVGDEEYKVRAGDTLHFKATLPHGWKNKGTEPATFLIIGSLPRVLRAALHRRLRGGDLASKAHSEPSTSG